MSKLLRYLLWVGIIFTIACSPRISFFDQYAYTQVTSIKVDALNLMSEAADNFSVHENEVKAMDITIRKMIEYEKHRPKDSVTLKQWEKLYDPKKYLYGGFINRWRQKSKLDSAFIADQQNLIGKAFDQIAELESGKLKSKEVK